MEEVKRRIALGLVVIIAIALVYSVNFTMSPFGAFPQRQIDGRVETAVGEQYLENAIWQTGATNVVTSVVWGYRGYDTLGESTVLFTAVIGVLMVLRGLGRED